MATYGALLEQLRQGVSGDDEPEQEASTGFIPRNSTTRPKEKPKEQPDAYDPIALMREWMGVIKASGEASRKKAQALIDEQSVETEPEQKTRTVSVPNEEPVEEKKRRSAFDLDLSLAGDNGENFKLPVWKGANGEFQSLAREAADANGIPQDLFLSLINQESGFNANAKSPVGAFGLAQLMPSTAKYLGVDPKDPKQNLNGGARYLREQYDTFGSWPLALAAYNAGPGNVQKHGGIPPFKETQNYVKSILR